MKKRSLSYRSIRIPLYSLIILGLVVAAPFLVYLYNKVKLAKEEQFRTIQLRMIYMDLVNHSDVQGEEWPYLPEAKYRHESMKEGEYNSWRAMASNYLMGTSDVRRASLDIRRYWKDPLNIRCDNSRFCWTEKQGSWESYWTNVMAITGPDTAWDLQTCDKLYDCEDLIIAAEVDDSCIHWMQPGDIDISIIPWDFFCGIDGDGVLVLFLDGSIWHLDKDIPFDKVRPFFTASGAREYDRWSELRPFARIHYAPPGRGEE